MPYMPSTTQTFLLFLSLSLLSYTPVCAFRGDANFPALCNAVRLEMILADPSLANNTNLECRDSYTPEKEPALSISISVSECLRRCPRYQAAKLNVLNQWIGPLVGFLLPALAFVITIPRPLHLPQGDKRFASRKLIAIRSLLLALCINLVDIILWIITVFAFAGPMIAGSIHEAVIDHAALTYAESALTSDPFGALAAVTFTLVGSMNPDKGDLSGMIYSYILESPHGKRKLENLLSLLPSYGARVGVPIVFYLGAYAYALFDAKSKIGDNDTAHAVAFGLWYGVVVIVAIVSSSVLGIDNPSSLNAVFSENMSPATLPLLENNTSRTEESFLSRFAFHNPPFVPAWLYSRARNFNLWTENAKTALPFPPVLIAKIHSHTPRFLSGLLASVLIALPCAGACWISYSTPSVGFGCRSVCHLIYAGSQIILILVWWTWHNAPTTSKSSNFSFSSISVLFLSTIALVAGLVSSIGGTIMQLVGVFKNCICKASLMYLLPASRKGAIVLLANDMKEHRDNARWWIVVGSVGVAFIGSIGVLGWAYQARVRARVRECLKKL
ncbi:hypothetical protein B0J11DRAFT_513461 [Dendryphion nanum]|uniref:Uncharacterized protein n=1 Tax=Dendryphion nanum TaxID=256645 RepID=A0A9P9EGY3_9PLEO|nr:hypothetical protein B0J11DRAFT_513461 [Dendryphion nanum]